MTDRFNQRKRKFTQALEAQLVIPSAHNRNLDMPDSVPLIIPMPNIPTGLSTMVGNERFGYHGAMGDLYRSTSVDAKLDSKLQFIIESAEELQAEQKSIKLGLQQTNTIFHEVLKAQATLQAQLMQMQSQMALLMSGQIMRQ